MIQTSAAGGWRDPFLAENLGDLSQHCLRHAEDLLAPRGIEASWLVLHDPTGAPPWWVLLTAPVRRGRYFLQCPLIQAGTNGSSGHAPSAQVLPEPAWRLIIPQARPQPDEPEYLPAQTIAVPLGPNPCRDGVWMISLKGEGPISEETLAALAADAQLLAWITPRLVQCERLALINTFYRTLHDLARRAMNCSDPSELFHLGLHTATRQFGFDRVLLALLDEDGNTLQTAAHTGFNDSPPPGILNRSEHEFFFPLLMRNELVLDDLSTDDAWPNWGPVRPLRRAVVPLQGGLRPVGFIYADQTELPGTPLFKEALELFGRQMAISLENLKQRMNAERRAETDALTGLHNRAYLDRLLELEIPRVRRYNHPISLLMIDLFDFKRVNDTWGHAFGDAMLRETAQLLKANVRTPDVVVRYGGDEFVVVMVNTGPAQADLVRRRIEHAFILRNRLHEDDSRMIHLTVGMRSADAETLGDLLVDADMAMYANKARQKRQKLVEALIEGVPEKIEAADRVVGNLCMMLYKKAPFYAGHARRVAALSTLLAERLGIRADELQTLVLASLLHGIGKVSLPSEILIKPEPLTPGEQAALRTHVQIGDEFFEGLEHLEPLRPILMAHHERFDGQCDAEEFPAYPHGVSGERIPLPARILKLAEAVDSIVTDRPWRAGRPADEARAILQAEAGRSFDPRLVSILLSGDEWLKAVNDPLSYLKQHLELGVVHEPAASA